MNWKRRAIAGLQNEAAHVCKEAMAQSPLRAAHSIGSVAYTLRICTLTSRKAYNELRAEDCKDHPTGLAKYRRQGAIFSSWNV